MNHSGDKTQIINLISKKLLTNCMKDEYAFKTIKVSQKGQIAIPSDIQKITGIKKGDNLLLVQKGNKILLQKVNGIISQVTDDFKDIEAITEDSLKKFWQNEPDIWEQYLK
jgi:AbrB family looped-hinge helix DNA binding protein